MHLSAFLFIDLNTEMSEFFPQSPIHGFQQPLPTVMSIIDQHHKIVSKPRILDIGVAALPSDALRPPSI